MKKSIDTLRFLFDILWHYDKAIFIYFVFSCCSSALLPYVGILLPKYVIQGLLTHQPLPYWTILLCVFGVGSMGIGGIAALTTQLFKAHISAARNGCFGKMITDKMLRIRYSLLEDASIQELCFRANFLFWSENSGVAGVFDGMNQMISGMLSLMGVIVILSGLNPWIPVFLIVLILLNMQLLVRARNNENNQRHIVSKHKRELEYLSTIMHDTITGKDIRLYGMNAFLIEWYRSVSSSVRSVQHNIRAKYTQAELLSILVAFLRDILLYIYFIYLILNGRMTADNFIMYLGAVSSFTLFFTAILDHFLKVRQFIGQTEDFQSVLALDEDPDEGSQKKDPTFSGLEMKDVSFSYSNGFSLQSLQLRIESGEHIAIVGPNGSGKTTLVKLILGLYQPQSGEYNILDAKGNRIEGRCFETFSTVMQKIFQYAMTVGENISFQEDDQCDMGRLQNAISCSQLNQDIAEMPGGIRTMLRKDFDVHGINLSGGQLQKMALARAVYKDAPVMVLDEPSAALDPIAEQRFYEIINELFRDKTCIYVSHRLASVRFCNRIILMDGGRIVGIGSHEELLAESTLYQNMYHAQSRPYWNSDEEEIKQ